MVLFCTKRVSPRHYTAWKKQQKIEIPHSKTFARLANLNIGPAHSVATQGMLLNVAVSSDEVSIAGMLP